MPIPAALARTASDTPPGNGETGVAAAVSSEQSITAPNVRGCGARTG